MMDEMRLFRALVYAIILVNVFSSAASGQMTAIMELNKGLMYVAGALAMLMIAIQGLKWITSESPQDRMEAKKGLIYVVIGLLVVSLAAILVVVIYCNTINRYYFNNTLDCMIEAGMGSPTTTL